METNKIKALLSAVKAGSLSRAAEEFLYTPSALSHMADSLEEELHIKLLSRTHTGVELTAEGKALYEKLNAVISAEEELVRAAERLVTKKGYSLRIGCYSSISSQLLPELLTDFKKDNPEIKILISVDGDLQNWLDDGLAEIVFADDIILLDKERTSFMEDPYMVVVPEGYFSKRKTVKVEELYKYRYICTNEELLKSYLDEEKFTDVIKIESNDSSAILSMVSEGIGFAVLPSLSISKNGHGYKALRLSPSFSRTLSFAYKKGSYATELFVEYLNKKLKTFKK